MSQKIKSITINLPVDTISFNQIKITDIDKLDKDQLQALHSLAIINGNVEYEKPTILKRPDGSVISEPHNKNVWRIARHRGEENYSIRLYGNYDNSLELELKTGLIYLAGDTDLAEKKANMLTKQFEIQFEIDRLNAEEGWVEDWEDQDQIKKYFLYDLDAKKIAAYTFTVCLSDRVYMSEETAETILAKYSQDELKQYLGIII